MCFSKQVKGPVKQKIEHFYDTRYHKDLVHYRSGLLIDAGKLLLYDTLWYDGATQVHEIFLNSIV